VASPDRSRTRQRQRDAGADAGARRLGVATYNLYLGADFAPLFTATSQQELLRARTGRSLLT
jgi:hypothetical protein